MIALLVCIGLATLAGPAVQGQSSILLPGQPTAAYQSLLDQRDDAAATSTPAASLRDQLTANSAPSPASLVRLRPSQAPLTPIPTVAPPPVAANAPVARRAPSRTSSRERGRGSAAAALAPARLWPLAPASYDISQPFGCVPALLGYYPALAGCPDGAPAFHSGLDLAAPAGTPIFAVASGSVTVAGLDRPSGIANTRIVIQHDGANSGYASEYFHWQRAFVRVGDYVEAGDQIAEVGSVGFSTGPHLHFSIYEFSTGAQLDPVAWLPETNDSDRYTGLAPTNSGVTFGDANLPVPDYADPAPAPPPVARDLPSPAVAAAEGAEPAGDAEANSLPAPAPGTNSAGAADSPERPSVAEPAAATTTAEATMPTVDISRDAGTDADQESASQREDRTTPPPTVAPSNPFNPSLTGSPLNPMVITPTPATEPESRANDRKQGRDR